MTTSDQQMAAKKRIMFIKGEDFNYLAYNILICLDALRCHSQDRPFQDHRKLAFLVDLISSPNLAPLLERTTRLKAKLSKKDLHALATAYSSGASRKHFVVRIIHSLATRGYLTIAKGEHDLQLDVWLIQSAIPSSFLTSEVYRQERDNIALLQKVSRFVRTMTFSTFLERFYRDHGVQVWHS